MSNKKEEKKSINDMIIEEAVKQFKEGKIQNSLDVESYLDGLLTGFEEKCIALYAKGVSLRDIEQTLKDIYGVKINKDDISRLISTVSEEVGAWRKRKLKPMYVFTYADCLYVPIKDDITTSKKAVYVIIGVDVDGYKEILGMWIDKS